MRKAAVMAPGLATPLPAISKAEPCAGVAIGSFEVEEMEEVIMTKGRLDINLADERGLEKLPGIGKSLAGRIVSYRQSKGRFSSVEELKDVKGIGDKLFDRIKDRVSVE